MNNHPETFTYQGETLRIEFVESIKVCDGVSCDLYSFPESPDRDLAIGNVEAGKQTPPQRVVGGAMKQSRVTCQDGVGW